MLKKKRERRFKRGWQRHFDKSSRVTRAEKYNQKKSQEFRHVSSSSKSITHSFSRIINDSSSFLLLSHVQNFPKKTSRPALSLPKTRDDLCVRERESIPEFSFVVE